MELAHWNYRDAGVAGQLSRQDLGQRAAHPIRGGIGAQILEAQNRQAL
jgi:hypothetical protein